MRRAWRQVATVLLVVGIAGALLSSRLVEDPSPLPELSQGELPAALAPLGASMNAWQQASDGQRTAYVAWLVTHGLERRRALLGGWIAARADARAETATMTLSAIFLVLAGASLLLTLLPLAVRRASAPRRLALWLHSAGAALTLSATFLLMMVGLDALTLVTTNVTQQANPEQGLVDAAFDEIEQDARSLLAARVGTAGDPLPYGPVVGAGAGEPDGGYLANILRNLQYFDPEVFRPAVAWARGAWRVLGLIPHLTPFLVALVFLLTMRATLGSLMVMPLEAGRGVPHSGRKALAGALRFVGRELLAIVLLIGALLAVSILVHVGVRVLSHRVVTHALDHVRTTVEYFGHLQTEPEQTSLTLGILTLPAFLLAASALGALGLGLFALRARRLLQHGLRAGLRCHSLKHRWLPALVGLLRLQWIPIVLLWVLSAYLTGLHDAPVASAGDALGRLTHTFWVLALGLPAAFFLLAGPRAVRDLWPFARVGLGSDTAAPVSAKTPAPLA